MTVLIGPTFPAELEVAGLTGLPFSWCDDGTFVYDPTMTAPDIAAVEVVYAAHDPTDTALRAVTQATSKSTGVELNFLSGLVTMHNAALAADVTSSFVLTNSEIAATDMINLNHFSGGTIGAYSLNAQAAAGSATINVTNRSAGSLSDALVLRFSVAKDPDA